MQIKTVTSMAEVSAAEWDALAGNDNPFIEHAFLKAFEDSGSVGPRTGWAPMHTLVRDGGRLIGAAPAYLKSHSYGEYIFDWGWANAAQRAGIRYYPKLLAAVPFTPATGHRVLSAEGHDAAVQAALFEHWQGMRTETRASSLHVLFCTQAEQAALQAAGYLPRLTYQFHWRNENFRDFTDFLETFRAQPRKQTRKERREAAASGLTLRTVRGPDLTDEEWDSLYPFYLSTTSEKGGTTYLTPQFFERIRETFAHRIVVALASQNGKPVAGALAFERGKNLYGRYWGTLGNYDFLHFELCYYQLIDYAIANKLELFEAGAQGEHKIKRGFLPAPIYSAHWIEHEGLRAAIDEFLGRERLGMQREMDLLAEHGPFHRLNNNPMPTTKI